MNKPSIIFEDNHILVIIKDQGVPSQPDESGDLDMLTILKGYRKENEAKGGEAFVGLVHRLDRVTGGVMVFAKTSKSAMRLSEQMRNGGFSKKYLAITEGVPKKANAKLENYLLKNEHTNKVDIVGQAVNGAKRAELTYYVRDKKEDRALLEIDLATGRSHQIRVQLSYIGTPILGDAKYGNRGGALALWASELSFNHPTSGDRLRFSVFPPESGAWEMFDFGRKSHKTRGTENVETKQ